MVHCAHYFRAIKMVRLFFIILFGLNQVIAQQVINIESRRYDRLDTGWHGNIEFMLNYLQNQNKITTAGNKTEVMFNKDLHTYLFINELNFIRLNNTNLDYNTYQHLRYKRHIKDWLSGEAFAQTQFNQQLGLDFRGLLGAGPRFRLLNTDSIKVFLGPMWMYEYEVERPNKKQVVTNRASIYLSFVWINNGYFNINLLGYYQPDVVNPEDYRILSELRLELKMTQRFLFRCTGMQSFDSKPPPGIPNALLNLRNSVVYSF